MTHQDTWSGVGASATFFAVTGAAVGNKFQENAGAVLSVLALVVMWAIQIRQRIHESRRSETIAELESQLREAELRAEIEKTKKAAADAASP